MEYLIVDTIKKDEQNVINSMASNGWIVVSKTNYSPNALSCLIKFKKSF